MGFKYIIIVSVLILIYSITPIAAAPILSAGLEAPSQVEPYTNFEAKLTLYNGGNSPAFMIRPMVEVPSGFKIKMISSYPSQIKPKEKTVIKYLITTSKAPNPVSIKCSVSYSDNALGKGTMMVAPCGLSITINEGNIITQSYQLNIDATANFISSEVGVKKNFVVYVYSPDRNIISQTTVSGSKKFTVIGIKAGRYEIKAFGLKILPFPFHKNEIPVSVSKFVLLTSKKPKADVQITLG